MYVHCIYIYIHTVYIYTCLCHHHDWSLIVIGGGSTKTLYLPLSLDPDWHGVPILKLHGIIPPEGCTARCSLLSMVHVQKKVTGSTFHDKALRVMANGFLNWSRASLKRKTTQQDQFKDGVCRGRKPFMADHLIPEICNGSQQIEHQWYHQFHALIKTIKIKR